MSTMTRPTAAQKPISFSWHCWSETMSGRWNRTIVLSVLVVLAMSCATYACPMCKDSIPNSDAADAVALPTGFNYSVYTMLVGFMAVLAVVSGMIFKAVRE